MSSPTETDVARQAAERLAAEMPEGLEAAVEARLAAGPDQTPQTYLDPATAISLGSLIVSAASLAWTIYKDLKAQTPQPSKSVVTRRVQMRMRESGRSIDTRLERIVDVVVDEVIEIDPE